MAVDPHNDNDEHVSQSFYRWQFSATLLWWTIIRLLTRKHLYEITNGSVFTSPSWLPSKVLYQLQQHRKIIFISSLLAMGVGGWGVPLISWSPQEFPVRFLVALLVSLYHLVESSVTHRHGEYPLLYNVWAMCLPSEYASAASWGIAIHFVMSTGLAKLLVGGRDWMDESTMRFYLTTYYSARMKMSRPFLPSLNRWACQRSWATAFIAISTNALECGIIPLTLLLPPHTRWIGSTGMILMHIGIFVFMSKKVGVVFITTISTYLVGFRCTARFGTGPWWCALLVAFLPNLLFLGLAGRLLPEDWPSSPVSLFMWSGSQAKILADTLMTGDTRVVLATADKSSPQTIVGLPVIHHGAVAPTTNVAHDSSKSNRQGEGTLKADRAVHDCVLRVIGFTILQENLFNTIPLNSMSSKAKGWDIQKFLNGLQTFLETERRLFESQSGLPLLTVYYVEIDGDGNVAKVLSKATTTSKIS